MILSGFAFLWLRNLVLNQRLKANADSLISAYETARVYTMTGRGQIGVGGDWQSRPWGVYISGNTYALFEDANYNCQFDTGEAIKTFTAEPGIILTPASGCNTVIFDKKGYPRNSACGLGMCSVVLQNSAGSKRTVYIDRYGRIRYETQ
jgi:type IV fimbrial biogenesis protein FimT